MTVHLFFLGGVLIAGLFGAATVGKNILFIQGLPAALAMAMVWLTRYGSFLPIFK